MSVAVSKLVERLTASLAADLADRTQEMITQLAEQSMRTKLMSAMAAVATEEVDKMLKTNEEWNLSLPCLV